MIDRNRPVSHPGIYIRDAIDELGLNQSEFAIRSGLSIKNVSTLLNGESDITFEVALKLSSFFDNSVEGWLNLQTKYDLYKNEERRKQEYKDEWDIAKTINKEFAINYLGITIDSKNKEKTIDDLRKALGVGVLQSLKHPDMYAFCKTSVIKDINEEIVIARNVWILSAEKKAREISCSSFNKEKLLQNIFILRSLTRTKPEYFESRLKAILSDCGVKLVILPYLSKSNVSGVTKWLNNENCVLVAVNDCGKDADKIWFSIFHELGHAIKNHKRHLTISYQKNGIVDIDEIEANEFARNALIDKESYQRFVLNKNFDLTTINNFAKQQNVANFIVIGRLQKDGYISWSAYSDKKIKYSVIGY